MAKLNGWKETIFLVMMFGGNFLNFLLIGLSNAMMVVFFLSGINLSILVPLNLAVYKNCNTPNIQIFCVPHVRKKMNLTPKPPPPPPPHPTFYCKVSKITLEYIGQLI